MPIVLRAVPSFSWCIFNSSLLELHDGANLAADGEGYDDGAGGGMIECWRERVTQLCRHAVLHPQATHLEAVGQEFHRHADVVGIVHVAVVVDVGPHHADGLQHLATLAGQDDAAVAIRHVELRFQRHRADGGFVDALQLPSRLVDEGTHAPRAVAGLPFGIVDEGVAETVHRLHAVDGGGNGELLLEAWHANDLHLPGCQQLSHVLLGEILLHTGF